MNGSKKIMHSYATYFDTNYLPRALALFESLRHNGDQSEIYALLLDDIAGEYFAKKTLGIKTISLIELEHRFPELLTVKDSRSKMEYIFTLTPWLLKYVAEQTNSEVVIYLDSDLYFFNDPDLVVNDMAGADVGIIEHKYPKVLRNRLAKYGNYNVGWVGVRKSPNGLACLNWWSEKCLEWCSDKPEPGRYADQGYLDQFADLFKGVKVLKSQGFNLAPWNSQSTRIISVDNSLLISTSRERLVFFHFHGLKALGKRFATSHLNYLGLTSKSLISNVYIPYAKSLIKHEALVRAAGVIVGTGNVRGVGLRSIAMRVQRTIFALLTVLTGNSFRVGPNPKELNVGK